MKQCEKCGSSHGQGQVVCQQCSNTVMRDEGKKCPFCETYCGPFAKVCSSCGHPLFSQYQEDKEPRKRVPAMKDNVIAFNDAKKLKKQRERQAKKQQRRPQKIGQLIFFGVLVVLFILGVVSMFL